MNPETEKTDFIVEGDTSTSAPETPSGSSFSVLPHLAVIGIILFAIFSTIVVPKTLTYLQFGREIAPAVLTVESVAAVHTPLIDPTDITIKATSAYVWDIETGEALYQKNATEAVPLASITKLMTALLAYELAKDDTPVTITPAAAALQSGGTLRSGEVFTIKDLADFALISSFNSAAETLAASVGERLGDNDPTEQFVAGMNIRAEELGFESLSFKNPTGLDVSATEAGAYGTAEEVSLLVSYIYEHYPEILSPTVAKRTRLYNKDGEYHEAVNTNEIVGRIPNLLGSKTGYTDLARGNLTIIFDAGFNRPIVITVMGSSRSERFSDVETLLAAVQNTLATE